MTDTDPLFDPDQTRPDLERALIGAAILNPQACTDQITTITSDLFTDPRHAHTWRQIIARHTLDQPIDPLLLATDAAKTPWPPGNTNGTNRQTLLSALGGATWYTDTCRDTNPTWAATYATELTNAHTQRELHAAHTRLGHAITNLHDPHERARAITELTTHINQLITGPDPRTGETDTWQPLDLEPILAGGVLTPPPVLLARTDLVNLIYLGRMHSLSGEPEAGKSFVALIAVLQAITDGYHVIYLDYEDTPEGIVGRLLAMGARPDDIRTRLHYIRPDRPTDPQAIRTLTHIFADAFTVLVVIDGVTEAMITHGLDPQENTDAVKFYEALPRKITRQPNPPAVLLLDHVPKSDDRNKRYAFGAQHKLAGLDGVAYMIDIVKPFSPGNPGTSRIRIAKDRPGQVRRNAPAGIIAELHIDGAEPILTAELRPPLQSGTPTPNGHWRPTILMAAVSRWLEVHPGATATDIAEAVRGRRANVLAAVEALAIEGFIRREPGPRRTQYHYSESPFRDDEAPEPDDNDTQNAPF